MTKRKTSFCSCILSLLKEAKGNWVSAFTVASVGGLCHSKRIHELRKRGVDIENKVERKSNGILHSWYRLP